MRARSAESCRNLRDRTELFLFLLTKCMLMCSSESIILLDLRPACLDNATTSNRDVGCPADKPLCGSGGFNAGTYIGGSVCFACLDSTTGSAQDDGCPAQAPLCGAGGLNSGTNVGGNVCFACLDSNTTSNLDVGCPADKPLCAAGGLNVGTNVGGSACKVCLDSASGAVRDDGCSAELPICGAGGLNSGTNFGGDACYACQDDQQGYDTDFGCGGATPYCNVGRHKRGYGLTCSEYPNPSCLFGDGDFVMDSSDSCPTDVAVEASVTIVMANCTVTRLNLTALAASVSAALNVSSCSVLFEPDSSYVATPTRRHLLQEPSSVTLGLIVFVPDAQAGSAVLANIDTSVKLAILLAIVDLDIGDVVEVSINKAVVLLLSSVTSDPHFVTPKGSRFDFNGVAGQSYCIISDRLLHVNAHFMGAAGAPMATAAGGSQPDARTWMDQVAVLYGEDRVLVDAVSPPGAPYTASFGTVLVNGRPLLGRAARTKLPSGLTVARNKMRVLVSVPGIAAIEMETVRAGFWERGSGPGRNFLNLQVKELNSTKVAHGILGQTFSRNSVGQIEGNPQEYSTSGIFATDCFFSQFGRND
eukprot:jgi/Mesvir1/442/Mv11320-RA.2